MYVGLHVKYPLFLCDFNVTWIFSKDFRKIPQIWNFMKIFPVSTKSLHADGQTDRLTQKQIGGRRVGMTKSRFRNFVNARKTLKVFEMNIFIYMYGDTLRREAPVLLEAGLFDNSYRNRPDT
jgi:hypothetical protein